MPVAIARNTIQMYEYAIRNRNLMKKDDGAGVDDVAQN
jgi:hypothetical protein